MTEINGKLPCGTHVLPIHINDTLENSRQLTRNVQGKFYPYSGKFYWYYMFDDLIGDYKGFVCLKSSIEIVDDHS